MKMENFLKNKKVGMEKGEREKCSRLCIEVHIEEKKAEYMLQAEI